MDLGLPTNGARDAGKHLRAWGVSWMRRGLPAHELRNCTPGGDAGRKKCLKMSTPVENSAFRRSEIPVITKNLHSQRAKCLNIHRKMKANRFERQVCSSARAMANPMASSPTQPMRRIVSRSTILNRDDTWPPSSFPALFSLPAVSSRRAYRVSQYRPRWDRLGLSLIHI